MYTPFELQTLPVSDSNNFESLANSVKQLLRVPVVVISRIENGTEVSVVSMGIGQNDMPQFTTFSQHVTMYEKPFIVNDASTSPVLIGSPVVDKLRIQSYLGFPLTSEDGTLLGVLSVADNDIHRWAAEEILLVKELSDVVASVMQGDMASAHKALQSSHTNYAAAFDTQLSDLRSILSE